MLDRIDAAQEAGLGEDEVVRHLVAPEHVAALRDVLPLLQDPLQEPEILHVFARGLPVEAIGVGQDREVVGGQAARPLQRREGASRVPAFPIGGGLPVLLVGSS